MARSLLQWKGTQAERAVAFMLENVSPAGTRRGTIIASPTRGIPNYFRHWVRDGAIVADVIISLWDSAQNPRKKNSTKNFCGTTWSCPENSKLISLSRSSIMKVR